MKGLLTYLRTSADNGTTDRQLLDRFTTCRDEAAFAVLVRRHGPLVWGVCRRNLANPADAEDAFQATFLVLVRRAAGLARHAAVGPWLYRVAVWCCRNVRRGNRRRLGRVRLGLTEPAAPAEPATDPDLSAALDAALLSMPAKYREAVVLCHLQGWTRREAAAHLGCPEGTLSAHLSRALAKLRAKLADRDPAAVLAVAGALAAPPDVTAAAVRAAVVYTAEAGAVSPVVLSTADGVLRMIWMNNLRFAAVGVMAVAGLVALGAGLTARSTQTLADPQPPTVKSGDPPALVPGKWALFDYEYPRREAILTVATQDGKPAVTAVAGDRFEWQAKDLTVTGRRVRVTLTQEGGRAYQFEGSFDPADATRVVGSLVSGLDVADRAALELVRPGRPAKPPPSPSRPLPADALKAIDEQNRAVEADRERGKLQANAELRRRLKKEPPAGEEQALRAADAAVKRHSTELARLYGTMVAEQADTIVGYQAVQALFSLLDDFKPTAAEVDSWAKAARTFAARYGPQLESVTLGRIARRLAPHAPYAAQARAFAAEADKLAAEAGLPPGHAKFVAAYDEERAAWAAQANPPVAGAIWTVSLTGKVTDTTGNPVADAEVRVDVHNMPWTKVGTDVGPREAKTGPDGRYTITLECRGEYRLHVARMTAEKRGLVRAVNAGRRTLLPGQSAAVDFTLAPGEPFGGMLRLRPTEDRGGRYVLRVKGAGVDETVDVRDGYDRKFELTLPPGTYAVELDYRGEKVTWAALKSGTTDHVLQVPPFRFTPATVGAAFDALWNLMDRDYSSFTLKPDVDWAKLRDEYRPKAVTAKSADELAAVLKAMLGHLKDEQIWIELPNGDRVDTHRTAWSYNGNRKVVLAQLEMSTECGEYAVVGRTWDQFGYFLMTRQSAAAPELVAKAEAAIKELANAPGFVIDLRGANGGGAQEAFFVQEIAQLFCGNPVEYARNRVRDGRGHDEFTGVYRLELRPAKSGKVYLKPVVCLLGPGCASNGERLAQMLAALPQVTTVGLPTRGSSGNPAGPFSVGDTGLTFFYTRSLNLLPDGTPIDGKGVPPAVRVEAPADAYRDADPTLTKGLEVLRRKAAGGERLRN